MLDGRGFDPLLFDRLDSGFAANEDVEQEDFTLVERCTTCGAEELVFEEGQLVDLDGNPHVCPEA